MPFVTTNDVSPPKVPPDPEVMATEMEPLKPVTIRLEESCTTTFALVTKVEPDVPAAGEFVTTNLVAMPAIVIDCVTCERDPELKVKV